MKRVRRITHGAAAVVGMDAVAMAAVSTPALAASSPSPDATTLSADTVAARRAALDTEPRPVVTDEMCALLAAKDKEATAYWNKKMATASAKKLKSAGVDVAARTAAAQGLAAGRPCPDGDCSWNAIAANHQSQTTNYYCGPATLVMAVGNRGVSISQDTAARDLGTTGDGTAWYNGSFPMANALNKYQGSMDAKYAAVGLAGNPSNSEVASYKTHLVSNIDRKWAIAGNAYEARRRLAALLALVLVGASGCSPTPPAKPHAKLSKQPGKAPSAAPSGGTGEAFCQVPLPEAWRAALTAHRVNKPGEDVVTRAASEDGKVVFVEVGGPGSQGHQLAQLSDGGRRRVTVQSFGAQDKTSQVLGASFDGRYLAYSVSHLLTGWHKWTLYVWDSASGGAPKEISRSATDAKGEAVPGPISYPIAYQGRIYWPQGTAAGTVDIRQYDVTTGRQSVVRAGHPAGPFRMGGWLVWPESPAPDALTKLNAISLENGQLVALPAVMAAISGPAAIEATNDTMIWASKDRTELYVWKTSWPEPKRILQLDTGSLDRPHVAGQIVSWDDGKAQFALDLRSGTYTQVTPQYGSTGGWGNALAVEYGPQQSGPGDAAVVDTTALPPLPRCGDKTTSST